MKHPDLLSGAAPLFMLLVLWVGLPCASWGTPVLRITHLRPVNLANTFTADPLDPLSAGTVQFSGTRFGFTFIGVSGKSKPALGDAANPALALSGKLVQTALTLAPSVLLELSDTDFIGPLPEPSTLFSIFKLANSDPRSGLYTVAGYFDSTNTLFGHEHELVNFQSTYQVQDVNRADKIPDIQGPYSLTISALFSQTRFGIIEFDGSLTAVPEPGTLLLMVCWLLVVPSVRPRRAFISTL